MSELTPVTIEFLREHYAHLGLHPSEEELQALAPAVQSLYAGARQVEELLMLEQEPGVVFQHRAPDLS